MEQIKNQLYKLEDVKDIIELKSREAVCRELMIIKIGVTTEQRNSLVAIADIFRAKVVDVSVDTMMLELTGNQDKLDSFIRMLKDYTIIEIGFSERILIHLRNVIFGHELGVAVCKSCNSGLKSTVCMGRVNTPAVFISCFMV